MVMNDQKSNVNKTKKRKKTNWRKVGVITMLTILVASMLITTLAMLA